MSTEEDREALSELIDKKFDGDAGYGVGDWLAEIILEAGFRRTPAPAPQDTEWEWGFDHGAGSICLYDTEEEVRQAEGESGVVRRAVGPWEPVPTEGENR